MGNFIESGKIADVRAQGNEVPVGEHAKDVIGSGRHSLHSHTEHGGSTQLTQGRTQSLEESGDSGYEELADQQQHERQSQAIASRLDESQLSAELRPCICRTDCVLGRHYSYLGFRLIQFDPDCEGNRHITNEDL